MWTSDYRLLHARTEEIHANTMHTLVVVFLCILCILFLLVVLDS